MPEDDAPVPVLLITGFLGSGKSTLLNHLLRDPDMAATAVIINEFGDVAIDHLLVESAIENAIVLQSGCICCTVRGDLVDTLDDLGAKVRQGLLPPFTRIAIETTGLADPGALVHSLLTERSLVERFALRAVATTVDAVNAAGQLDDFAEARHQVALADILLLTKTDLAPAGEVGALGARLAALNPGAARVTVVNGAISPRELFALVPDTPARAQEDVLRWLNEQAFAPARAGTTPSHDGDIRAFALTLDRPVTRAALRLWLRALLSLRGGDLLRMKGIVNIAGEEAPLVVHAVRELLHPPVRLAAWPSEDHSTRLVVIARHIAPEALQHSLDILAGVAAADR
ncbi:GTP-binding protein [Ancylobacter sp. IITR112]|uniref:CobW family GTP-binding protein n=1 Tax=Ancylobacter sp. IITR112 TaxID=3138073 RepID=UPI00352BB4B8